MSFALRTWAYQHLRVHDVEEAGDGHVEIVADCPHCGRSKKLYLNARTGKWICYYCDRKGSPECLVSLVECVSVETAKERIYGFIPAPEQGTVTGPPPRERKKPPAPPPEALPDDFTPILSPEGRWSYPSYLKTRSIKPNTCARFGMGYSQRGRYANRVVMPITRRGRYSGFTTRAVHAHMTPKYLTSRALDKENLLFGYDQAWLEPSVVICEGPFDVLSLSQRGFPAVGLQGKTFTLSQYKMLVENGTNDAVIILDSNDPTAWLASIKACNEFGPLGKIALRVGRLPPDLDPATASNEDVERAISESRVPTLVDRAMAQSAYNEEMRRRKRAKGV